MTNYPLSKEELIKAIQNGQTFKYLYFWGHSEKDLLTKACLSQWYPASFTLKQIEYRTAEHYMMACKARLFDDQRSLKLILDSDNPKQAKAYGRSVKGFDQRQWAEMSFNYVVEANFAKFSQNPHLEAFLLGTNKRILVEAAPPDRIWGIGLGQDDPRAQCPTKWRGENLLGFALMKVREQLASTENRV